ncbi:hypothetical protein [Porphyrobacter sp. YT40]|uniref:hypothetical protein n=1 Tax=Porphyrobacter sp. YT40 TaxID=2547601 RepID=UPI001142714D|nr:hypothetical protein [Porphyrobacter sp. YT40]QDH35813.1 hypothetical protein E2E27_16730 [Porphyrobacter sp. YT40]
MSDREKAHLTIEAFADHLQEAVETLGYFESAAFYDLLECYRQRWDAGTSSTILRKDEVLPLLSAKGRVDPRHAQIATYSRASFNMYREQVPAREQAWSKLGTDARFSASVKMVCDQARSKDGTVVPIEDRWPLPLPECGQEWCPCSWHLVYERRSKR